jgi:anti-sigma regulatory factor (Ser/Thr protein kinase)
VSHSGRGTWEVHSGLLATLCVVLVVEIAISEIITANVSHAMKHAPSG